RVVFHDSDAAAGGSDHDLDLPVTIELGDRKDLLDDFLKTVRLKRADIKLDTLAELDPDRRGKERLVAGGTVIGVLTDQFAYVAEGTKGPEVWVTRKPAVGGPAETWNEAPADDADPIALPWDMKSGGTAYTLTGKELTRRDLPAPKKKR